MPRGEGKPERFSPRGGIFNGTHIAIMPPLHPFRKARDCQIECKSKKCDFCSCEYLLKIKKPQTHGKSQRSEIFVNKAAEPRRKRAMPDRALRKTGLVRSRRKRGFAFFDLIIKNVNPKSHGKSQGAKRARFS